MNKEDLQIWERWFVLIEEAQLCEYYSAGGGGCEIGMWRVNFLLIVEEKIFSSKIIYNIEKHRDSPILSAWVYFAEILNSFSIFTAMMF